MLPTVRCVSERVKDKQNGLYWPEVNGQPKSRLGPLIAFATSQGLKVEPNEHQPFYGYYFAMLDKQGTGRGVVQTFLVCGNRRCFGL